MLSVRLQSSLGTSRTSYVWVLVSPFRDSKVLLGVGERRQEVSDRIAYIDLFAGPGRYEDGTLSTPLLVLKAAIEDEDMRSSIGLGLLAYRRLSASRVVNSISLERAKPWSAVIANPLHSV